MAITKRQVKGKRIDQALLVKALLGVLALSIVLSSYLGWQVWRSRQADRQNFIANNTWYAVKLVDGELIFGLTTSVSPEQLVLNPVYYNYDQKSAEQTGQKKKINESGDLRLVRRGGETHSPDGALTLVRSQVVYLEKMKPGSKVLKVILDNENKP